eukprot:m.457372 g.457372  ORF g.457372 m.457372 type:complete len:53 (-) comp21244_c0_seq1:3525-3683(-)
MSWMSLTTQQNTLDAHPIQYVTDVTMHSIPTSGVIPSFARFGFERRSDHETA